MNTLKPCRCENYEKREVTMYSDIPKKMVVCKNCGRVPDSESRAVDICSCFTCGHKWERGKKDGSHDCKIKLVEKIRQQRQEIEELKKENLDLKNQILYGI